MSQTEVIERQELTRYQPLSSHNHYRYLRLRNGLSVLVVHNAEIPRASAALSIASGSIDNPQDDQGLAHFLEHMLFLGTKKYPEPDEYAEFIQQHGGDHNAFTAYDASTYYFDIQPQALAQALDRLAQFFIAPCFYPELIEREVQAVNAEFHKNLPQDLGRFYSVSRVLMRQSHPVTGFSCGNARTLHADEPQLLRQRLLDFYVTYYSDPNRMALAVMSHHSLDELENFVLAAFAALQGNYVPVARPACDLHPSIDEDLIDLNSLPRRILWHKNDRTPELRIHFYTDDQHRSAFAQAGQIISSLLGYEGAGSLDAFLKAQAWATLLSAGYSDGIARQGELLLHIHLSEQGRAHLAEVEAALEAYLELLGEHLDDEAFFQNMLARYELLHNYGQAPSPAQQSIHLSQSMLRTSREDWLHAGQIYQAVDPQTLRQFFNSIRRERSITFLAESDWQAQTDDQRSPYYDVAWRELPAFSPDRAQIEAFKRLMHFPHSNRFVARDLHLLDHAIQPKPHSCAQGEWLIAVGNSFDQPKGVLQIALFPQNLPDLGAQMADELLHQLLLHKLNDILYEADEADLSAEIAFDDQAHFEIIGFAERQSELLRLLYDTFHSRSFSAQLWQQARNSIQEKIAHLHTREAYVQSIALLAETMSGSLRSPDSLERYFAAVHDEDIAQRQAAWQSAACNLRGMIYGNFSEHDIRTVEQLSAEYLPHVRQQSVPPRLALQLERGTRIIEHSVHVRGNHVLLGYLQAHSASEHDRVAHMLIAHRLETAFFKQLRTEQQLGYIVHAGLRAFCRHPGWLFLIQSPQLEAAALSQRVDEFLERNADLIVHCDEESFRQAQSTLVQELREAPQNLSQAAAKLWRGWGRAEPDLDYVQRRIQLLETFTPADMCAVFERDFSPASQHRLEIRIRA